jgi:hypothetical protein
MIGLFNEESAQRKEVALRIFIEPEVTMILTGGNRPRTCWASANPSIEPGMFMSVKMSLISS